jgi:hypothetical protein
MHSMWFAGAVLLVTASWAYALDEPKKTDPPAKDKPAGLAEQIAAYDKEFQAKTQALITHYRATQDAAEQTKTIQEYQALQNAASEFYLELARKQPMDPAALPALQKCASLGGNLKARREAAALIMKHHVASPGVGDAAPFLFGDDPEAVKKFIQAVVEHNPNKEDQGKALFVLARQAKQQASHGNLGEAEKAKALEEATKAYETIQAKYADVKGFRGKTLGQSAEGQLAAIRNAAKLAVGKEVLELAGEDLEGKAFQLSDYRGKVVLLDFWAHW